MLTANICNSLLRFSGFKRWVSYRTSLKCLRVDAPGINKWQRVFGGYTSQLPQLSVGIVLRYILHCLPGFLGGTSSGYPKWWLAWKCTLYWPRSFLSHLLTPLPVFPRLTSQKYHLYLTPCLRVCFWGSYGKILGIVLTIFDFHHLTFKSWSHWDAILLWCSGAFSVDSVFILQSRHTWIWGWIWGLME